jgi:hypothetical protein
VAPVVLAYYVELRSVLRNKPWLRKCQARCWHCGIFFLTDPRNAGRKDLGCPFGCRREHRRQESTRRSVAYYQEPEGKVKKQALNRQRRSRGRKASPVFVDPASASLRGILAYLCVLVGLIEGRRVHRWEVIGMLERTWRQHRMVRTRRLDQGVAWFNERPP